MGRFLPLGIEAGCSMTCLNPQKPKGQSVFFNPCVLSCGQHETDRSMSPLFSSQFSRRGHTLYGPWDVRGMSYTKAQGKARVLLRVRETCIVAGARSFFLHSSRSFRSSVQSFHPRGANCARSFIKASFVFALLPSRRL